MFSWYVASYVYVYMYIYSVYLNACIAFEVEFHLFITCFLCTTLVYISFKNEESRRIDLLLLNKDHSYAVQKFLLTRFILFSFSSFLKSVCYGFEIGNTKYLALAYIYIYIWYRFPAFFPLRTPVCIQPGSPLEVHLWRCCGSTKVNHFISVTCFHFFKKCCLVKNNGSGFKLSILWFHTQRMYMES